MNNAKPCNDRFEQLVALVMGELTPPEIRQLQDHLSQCDDCRATYDALVEEEKEVRSGFEALARTLGPIEQGVLGRQERRAGIRVNVFNNEFTRKVGKMIGTHKRLSAAAAAVAALAVGVMLCLTLFSSPRVAYALEQTVEAIKNVTSYHVKITPAAELGEAWVELKPDGSPLRARMDLLSPSDGPKVVILSGDKAEVWFKKKNSFVTVRDKNALDHLMKMRAVFDPKLAFEELQAAKKSGKMEVTTKEPAKKGEPITLTATSKDSPNRRDVYEVDPKSKLVQRVTVYQRDGDEWKQVEQREYLDYNKEIDPSIFKPELPKDVLRIDQLHQKIGLAQGDLTKDEIAKKVAREFFQALIAKDYKKAGLIYGGIPEEEMKKMFGRVEFLRIVEIGKPAAGAHPDPTALQVPVKVEWKTGGSEGVREFKPYVRPVHSQRDRWGICGGI